MIDCANNNLHSEIPLEQLASTPSENRGFLLCGDFALTSADDLTGTGTVLDEEGHESTATYRLTGKAGLSPVLRQSLCEDPVQCTPDSSTGYVIW